MKDFQKKRYLGPLLWYQAFEGDKEDHKKLFAS